jgi:hypothetical protein
MQHLQNADAHVGFVGVDAGEIAKSGETETPGDAKKTESEEGDPVELEGRSFLGHGIIRRLRRGVALGGGEDRVVADSFAIF